MSLTGEKLGSRLWYQQSLVFLSLTERFPDFYRKICWARQNPEQYSWIHIFGGKGFRRLCKLRMWRETPAVQTRFSSAAAAVKEQCQSTVSHLGLWSAVNCKHFHLNHDATSYSQINSSEFCLCSRNTAHSPQSISKEEQEKNSQELKLGHYWGKMWVIQYLWNHHSA